MSRLSDYAKQLVDINDEIKDLSTQLDNAKSLREELTQKFVSEMQEQDLTEVAIDGLGKKFTVKNDTYASYSVEDRQDVFNALRLLGQGDIIKEEINNKTFNSTINTLIAENGGELPDCLKGQISLFTKSKVSITKRS